MGFALVVVTGLYAAFSAREAEKLAYVLLERLRREFGAFHGGQIRKDRVGQVGYGEVMLNRECCGLDAIGSLGREDVRSEQAVGFLLGDEFDESTLPRGYGYRCTPLADPAIRT